MRTLNYMGGLACIVRRGEGVCSVCIGHDSAKLKDMKTHEQRRRNLMKNYMKKEQRWKGNQTKAKTKQNTNKKKEKRNILLGEEFSARFSWREVGEIVPVLGAYIFDVISDLAFSSADLSALTIRNFSVRQQLHRCEMLL